MKEEQIKKVKKCLLRKFKNRYREFCKINADIGSFYCFDNFVLNCTTKFNEKENDLKFYIDIFHKKDDKRRFVFSVHVEELVLNNIDILEDNEIRLMNAHIRTDENILNMETDISLGNLICREVI